MSSTNRFLLAMLAFVAITPRVLPADVDAGEMDKQISAVLEKALPATVAIMEISRGQASAFSGVVVSREGHILAASHAVEMGTKYRIHFRDGRVARAESVGLNRLLDCAMIKITETNEWPWVEMGDSQKLVEGQPVIALGFPGDQDRRRGAVVRLGSVVKPISTRFGMIHSTACMEPGDSGGGLFDLDGKLVGIRSQIQESLSDNFDVPVNTFRQYWDSLNAGQEFEVDNVPGYPNLGMKLRRSRRSGSRVESVDPDGPASTIGIEVGDTVLEVEGGGRGNAQDRIISRFFQGDREIELTIQRGETRKSMQLVLVAPQIEQDARNVASLRRSNVDVPSFKEQLVTQLATVESKLDDHVGTIFSDVHGESTVIHGLLMRDDIMVSKSSCVGENIRISWDGNRSTTGKVIARDSELDLVILQMAQAHRIPEPMVSLIPIEKLLGRILIVPKPDDQGRVGVLGSPLFSISKDRGRGYLGVHLDTLNERVILAEVMRGGAAEKAQLRDGDELVRIDDVEVKRPEDVYSYLRSKIPSEQIQIVLRRDGQEMSKSVKLGEVLSSARHVADTFDGGRSNRRDGFSGIFCHDTALYPHECGGPIFAADGGLLGLNLARYSRTLCFAIPIKKVQQFVEASVGK